MKRKDLLNQPLLPLYHTIDEFLSTKSLSPDQLTALRTIGIHDIFSDGQNTLPTQHLHILTGNPGAGKSYVVETIIEISELFQHGKTVTSSCYGVAAVAVFGTTLHSLFKFSFNDNMITTKLTLPPLNPQEIQQMQLDLDYSNLKLLIIDEFGTCDPTKLAVIDLRLKQIYNNDHLFGGLHCLLVGDLWQLPAISGCFASAMLEYERFLQLQKKHQNNSLPPKEMTQYHKWRKGKFHIQSLWRKGCSILASFKRFHLSTQHRSSDPQHIQFLSDMTNPAKSFDFGNFRNLYQPLTAQDFHDDPGWKFAPYIVATNRERIQISHIQAIEYAKELSSHVIRWPLPISKWINKPPNEDHQMDAQQDPAFYEYFVLNAPAYCTSNLNTNLGLANGTPLYLHSIIPVDDNQSEFIAYQQQTLPCGSIITLTEPPFAINVTIKPRTTSSPPLKAKLSVIHHHLTQCSVAQTNTGIPIIPILQASSAASKTYAKPISLPSKQYTVPGNQGYNPSKITVRPVFPIDLGFAMTVHKAQGCTLLKVILCLADRPSRLTQMQIQSLYVALSRVKLHSNIRLLYHSPNHSPDEVE